MNESKSEEPYQGFEQGPIRPPSEADSLLIRVTRNCPWNRCTFCPVYKRRTFSLRPVAHVKQDIDAVHRFVVKIQQMIDRSGRIDRAELQKAAATPDNNSEQAMIAALHWFSGGLKSIFIQDANSLVIKPADMTDILTHLKNRFPWTERITSYGRSRTIARIKDDDLKAISDAGLNRIHIGMESGSDKVLQMVNKGVTKEAHIKAGIKVKKAGMELSEYIMPGLGGRTLSDDHARESADALNQIDPHFIRLRTLAIPNHTELYKEYSEGRFQKCTDLMMAKEIRTFIDSLTGITGVLKSDHILNLFEEVEGKFPEDKSRMLGVLDTFLNLPPKEQCLYQVGRRLGMFSKLGDMNNAHRKSKVEAACLQLGVTPETVDGVIDEIMKQFV